MISVKLEHDLNKKLKIGDIVTFETSTDKWKVVLIGFEEQFIKFESIDFPGIYATAIRKEKSK